MKEEKELLAIKHNLDKFNKKMEKLSKALHDAEEAIRELGELDIEIEVIKDDAA